MTRFEMSDAIVQVLREYMANNKITYGQLGKRIGVSETAVGRWFTGRYNNFTIKTISQIESGLGISVFKIVNN